jgi:hypothetical protein
MSKDLIPIGEEPQLPALPQQMLPALAQLTTALGIPREVLAPDEEIAYAWKDLPRELAAIPREIRGELIARLCDGFRWEANGLRHSYISYRLAVLHDTARVALESGNSPKVIFAHYRELVVPDMATKWFSVNPS